MEDRYEKMKEIKEEIIACAKCPLYKVRNLPVVGEGSHKAKIMFVGEGPGANEDKTGRPFCGAAGKILDELLDSINLLRKDVYIANILKCRPPGNRDPEPDEIRVCTPYLERQIEIIGPEVLCPLGRYAMYFLLEKYGVQTKEPISALHGREIKARGLFKQMTIIPLYHPAVAAYRGTMIDILKEDFKVLEKYK